MVHRFSRSHFAVVLFGLALSTVEVSAQNDFEGSVNMTMSMASMTFDVQSFAKGGKVRNEMSMMGMQTVSVFDARAGTAITLMPAMKMYSKIDLNALAAEAAQQSPPKITATGKKETIAGHECENYTVVLESTSLELCVAKDLGFFAGSANMMGGGRGSANLAGAEKFWRENFKDGFFALRTTVTTDAGAVSTLVTGIEKKSVPDDMFKLEIPADFTEMPMPGRRGGGPGR
jgi:hypothetical protein